MWKPTIIFIDFLSDSSNLIHVPGAKSFAPSLLLLVFSLCQVILLLSVVIIVINILHDVAPSYLKDLVSVLPDSRYHLRRNNNGILLERPRLRTKKTLRDRALSMAAPFLWNSLPLPIRQETSIDSFKRSVKTYLFKKAFS